MWSGENEWYDNKWAVIRTRYQILLQNVLFIKNILLAKKRIHDKKMLQDGHTC